MSPSLADDLTTQVPRSAPQRILSWLFREDKLSLSVIEWVQLISATIFISNRTFLDEFFMVIKDKIEAAFKHSTLSSFKKELILYNGLSYLAYSEPKEGQTIEIGGILYTIQKIPLTSGWLSGAYCAYGLKDMSLQLAQSILLFKGTTFPTDSGFLAGILADTRPHGAVGAQLYSRGQGAIQAWINSEYDRTGKPVICAGQSLGGAMSLHAHIHQPDKVDFFAINPPSLTTREQQIYQAHAKNIALESSRSLKVTCHVNDPVFGLGSQYLPLGTKIFKHGRVDDHFLMAHAKAAHCDLDAKEPAYDDHVEPIKKNRLWKILKLPLFVVVIALHVLALPVRLSIQVAHTIAEYFFKKDAPANTLPSIEGSHARMHGLMPETSANKTGTEYPVTRIDMSEQARRPVTLVDSHHEPESGESTLTFG